MKSTLKFLGAVTIVLTASVLVKNLQHPSPASSNASIDQFSGPLVLDADGCEIFDEAGNSLKEAIREKGIVPKGALLNPNCFPVAKAARAELEGRGE
jgi:hypothetical protein